MENLELRLSDKKTTITDIRNTPAKFRGFELKHPKIGPMIKKPVNLYFSKGKRYNLQRQQRQQGSTIIWATVDKQRLINRLHMKGFCDKNGFPRELPWLSCMEPQVIIERYNAVIRGLAELYYGFIRNNSYLQRWIHILRFSCLKTLAQKYRTTIKGIFKKFGYKKDNTVQVKVIIKVKEILYEKNCTLWNYKTLMQEIKKNNNRKKEVLNNFWKIELLQ
jgi:hypothetical protein